MQIKVPEFCVVALVGVSGSGKSTFGRRVFKPTEVLSSDFCRGLVSDNENDQSATADAFNVLYHIAGKRLSRRKLTVIDATNVQKEARKEILRLAKENHCFAAAIVLNLPERVASDRNANRPDRQFGKHVIKNQMSQLRNSINRLKDEGFRYVYVLNSEEEVNSVEIVRERLWTNREDEKGPFDIIGDVHGCFDELVLLLERLGYSVDHSLIRTSQPAVTSSHDRKPIFLGDLVDRGPKSADVLALVINMVRNGQALCVPGNHDVKLVRWLDGKQVQLKHGLELTAEQFASESSQFKTDVRTFLDKLISHYVLDAGNLVVCHAGMKEQFQGRSSGKVREFALYGETTGEIDEYGLPVRTAWAEDYRGKALVVYGHTPVVEAQFLNNTICIDTGCVFGGSLTALRYPERELVSVPAQKTYYEPIRPLGIATNSALTPQQQYDEQLRLSDFTGKRIVTTRLRGNVMVREENAAAALEVMSRFAVNPKWLIYLPPTMSPSETTQIEGLLEHPREAIGYFKTRNVETVVMEEKHMGSRATIVVCKDTSVPQARFGVTENELGAIYTRSGRAFFDSKELEQALLHRVSAALEKCDFWAKFQTNWACIDAEILPWSLKATELLRTQYAAVGAAAATAIDRSLTMIEHTSSRIAEIQSLETALKSKRTLIDKYTSAYRGYCWPFKTIEDLKIAPFHILATEANVHVDKDHLWHMGEISKICSADERVFRMTKYQVIDTSDDGSIEQGIQWWQQLTSTGGEGCVVKSKEFIRFGKGGVLQPAVKCRGPEYLRIIYGPEYSTNENITRLKARNLNRKRSLALSEFSLGVEALERFVARKPLWQIHECVFGVLALESEPVDPRL